MEREYQKAINQIGRSTLGVFRSTPLGIIAAESGHTPARALLNHRQAGFAQQLYTRPRDGEGPKEIPTREGAAVTSRLRAAASLRPGNTAEAQEWGARCRFPGQIVVEGRGGALQTAGSWARGDTIWMDGSRLDNGKVGAACVWRTSGGWTGRRFHLGTNKEVFDAEVFAICQALSIVDQRQERGRQYTIFVDPTAAIESSNRGHRPRTALRRGRHRGQLQVTDEGKRGHDTLGPSPSGRPR